MVDFHLRDWGIEVTRINFWLLPSLTQNSIPLGRESKNIFFKNLMLNLKNNLNEAVFDEICKKNRIKIQFQKMKGTFLDNIPWLKSLQPPLVYSCIYLFASSKKQPLCFSLWILNIFIVALECKPANTQKGNFTGQRKNKQYLIVPFQERNYFFRFFSTTYDRKVK